MKTRLISTFEELQSIENDWVDLLHRAHWWSPFQDPKYNQLWWSTMGGGEWEDGNLSVFAAYDQAERLVGLAPLFQVPDVKSSPDIRLIGSNEISDYLDFIYDPDYATEFIEALLDEVSSHHELDQASLVLDNMLEGTATITLLESIAAARGWQVSQERLEPSPLLTLPDSFEAYFQMLESKQRREFKRKMRRAANYPARVTWRVEDQTENIDQSVTVFLELMANDAEKSVFLTEPMREHFRKLAKLGTQAGWLHIAFLDVSGEPVFAYMNFIAQDRLWVYNSGFNPDHYTLSPGWVLMGYLIQWAIERNFEAIDFMRGDEEYKYRLGGEDRFVCRMILTP